MKYNFEGNRNGKLQIGWPSPNLYNIHNFYFYITYRFKDKNTRSYKRLLKTSTILNNYRKHGYSANRIFYVQYV